MNKQRYKHPFSAEKFLTQLADFDLFVRPQDAGLMRTYIVLRRSDHRSGTERHEVVLVVHITRMFKEDLWQYESHAFNYGKDQVSEDLREQLTYDAIDEFNRDCGFDVQPLGDALERLEA